MFDHPAKKRLQRRVLSVTDGRNPSANRIFLVRPVHATSGRTPHAEENVPRLSELPGIGSELHWIRVVSTKFGRAVQQSNSAIR